ncbi:MAG: hypothetical protein NTW97_03210 [Candidatus Krumholzibacteria bacterium]|nr:hypothetical protein [Candidatus Krumholzibacteria bacterium]
MTDPLPGAGASERSRFRREGTMAQAGVSIRSVADGTIDDAIGDAFSFCNVLPDLNMKRRSTG